jgi:hypothetical protein
LHPRAMHTPHSTPFETGLAASKPRAPGPSPIVRHHYGLVPRVACVRIWRGLPSHDGELAAQRDHHRVALHKLPIVRRRDGLVPELVACVRLLTHVRSHIPRPRSATRCSLRAAHIMPSQAPRTIDIVHVLHRPKSSRSSQGSPPACEHHGEHTAGAPGKDYTSRREDARARARRQVARAPRAQAEHSTAKQMDLACHAPTLCTAQKVEPTLQKHGS